MQFEWDDKKHFSNKKKHGVGLDIAHEFDWDNAKIIDEEAFDEVRFIAYGHAADGRGYVIAFQFRGENIRVISARRFTARENKIYGY